MDEKSSVNVDEMASAVVGKKASVIVAVYNDLLLLKCILQSLKRQYTGQFEVLIADDGSGAEFVRQVTELGTQMPFRMEHVWHEDHGFRKTTVMNEAVRRSRHDWLIFIDGDCVPQSHFINDHLTAATPGVCLAGRRVDVMREAIEHLASSEPTQFFSQHWARFLWWSFTGKARNVERGLRLPRGFARERSEKKSWGLVGCNFSVYKPDLLAINGFDERESVPWGAEDSDIDRRLQLSGVKIQSLRYQATMIHFDASFFQRGLHPERDRARRDIFDRISAEGRAWTAHGIVKNGAATSSFAENLGQGQHEAARRSSVDVTGA